MLDQQISERIRRHLLWALGEAGNGRLPSIRTIAQELDCSASTVQKVVAGLKEAGQLHSRPGGGLYAALPVARRRAPVRRTLEGCLQELRKQIEEGKLLAGGRFAPVKRLSERMGCSVGLVRRAFAVLADEGMVEREGRDWRLKRRNVQGMRLRLLAIGQEDGRGKLAVRSSREEDFWRELAREADEWGLALEVLPMQSYGSDAAVPDFDPKGLAGIILSTLHLGDAVGAVRVLEARRLPLSVWMESPEQRIEHGKRTLLCDIGYSRHAGESMGRMLAAKGLHRVAWISPFHGARWSRERLDGLRQGLGREVEERCFEYLSDWELRPGVGEIESAADGMFSGWDPSRLFREEFARESVARRLQSLMEPVFDTLSGQGHQAWVLANDQCALLARDWLEKNRVGVGPFLCGFDDLFESMRLGMTSYRFPTREMVKVMVAHSLSPQMRTRRLALEGEVVR